MASSNLALWEEAPLWTVDIMEELGSASVPMTFQKGETILQPSNNSQALYLVERGVVNYRCYSDDGAAVTILQKRPGDVFGLKAIFGREEELKDYYIEAGSNVWLRKIPGEDFMTLMQSNLDFSRGVVQYFAQYIDSMERKIAHSAVMSSYQRLILILIEYAERRQDGTYVVRMTQQNLAELLFLSRQRVSVHLSKLTKQGLIKIKRGLIEILNWDSLNQEAK